MDPVVAVRGCTRTFRPRRGLLGLLAPSAVARTVVALDAVDLEVAAGERVTLVGPNGAGKSTLAHLLLGLLAPDAGEVRVVGALVGASTPRAIGWMAADDRSLVARLTAAENLQLHARLRGMRPGPDLDRRVASVLDEVSLGDRADDHAAALSAGMRARLQVARAVLHDPEVLLLDEPTGSLDPVAADEVLRLVERLGEQRGVAAIVASHRLDEVERLGGRVVVLRDGRVEHDGPVSALGRDGLDRLLRIGDGS